jgi:protein-tyrosine phosphatase
LLRKTGLSLTILTALSLTLVFGRPRLTGNFGIVEAGRVVRCAQPTTQLADLIRDHHLASILNLRGGSSKDWWYVAEVRTAQANGVAFYDYPLSATRRPSRRDLLVLTDVLERCRYPLLIHCKAGADRTGLASALYLMMSRGEPPEQAIRAFSLAYGHVPLFGPEHLHEPLSEYAAWLKDHTLSHSAERFRSWVKSEYRAEDPSADLPTLQPGPRHPL